MFRVVGVGIGQRCRCNSLNVSKGIACQRYRYTQRKFSPLELICYQRRLSSTSHASSSSTINVPLTDTSSLTSLPSGSKVTLGGWITTKRRLSKNLSFAVLLLPRGQGKIQLIARTDEGAEENANVASWDRAGNNGVVLIQGELHHKPSKDQRQGQERVSGFPLFLQ